MPKSANCQSSPIVSHGPPVPGAIGHRLYLAAEALGLAATGIGAFYDEEVHRYLNLAPEQGQVVYHSVIGYGVPDPRLGA
jgi:nitroreductase